MFGLVAMPMDAENAGELAWFHASHQELLE